MRPSSPDPDSPPQVIPRPPAARPGSPAPWAALAPDDRRGLSVAGSSPRSSRVGWTGTIPPSADGAVEVFDGPPPEQAVRRAAVLVALFEEAGEARVVLTRRSSTLRSHRGEVSFPGGGVDPGEDAGGRGHPGGVRGGRASIRPPSGRSAGSGRSLTFVTDRQSRRSSPSSPARPTLSCRARQRSSGPSTSPWPTCVADGVFTRSVGPFPAGSAAARPTGRSRSGSSTSPARPSGARRPGCSTSCLRRPRCRAGGI